MKGFIKSTLYSLGIEIRRAQPRGLSPGGAGRPIGRISSFLADIKARNFSPRGLVDVGANRGDWTHMALSIFPGTPVIMIEPQDEMEAALSRMAAEIPGGHYVKAGAGREEGELIQTIWEDLAGSSFLPETDEGKLEEGRQRKTKIVTIDALLSERFRDFHPDLIKLDIQGFELEALAGAESAFGRTEVFILETALFPFMPGMPVAREVIGFMAERGYELYDITDYLRRPHDGALGNIDLAFVKRDGMFRRSLEW